MPKIDRLIRVILLFIILFVFISLCTFFIAIFINFPITLLLIPILALLYFYIPDQLLE